MDGEMVESGGEQSIFPCSSDAGSSLPQMADHCESNAGGTLQHQSSHAAQSNQRGGLILNADSQEVCYISQSSQEDTSFLLAGGP